jgi:hypothetical protein
VIRYALLATACLSGIVLAARAALGPLAKPIAVNSPMNAAAIFGLSATLLLVFGRKRAQVTPPTKTDSRTHFLPLAIALLITTACFWPSLSFPLVSDDYTHVQFANTPQPEFLKTQFFVPAGDRFFRPLGYIDLKLESFWAGKDAWRWRFTNLLWHLANAALLFFVGRKLGLGAWPAAAAAAIFGVHGSRPEVVAWVAARFDLLAAFFVLGAVLAFVYHIETKRRLWLLASLASSFLALISKEAAYVLPAILVIVAVSRAPIGRAIRVTGPFFALTLAVFLYRWQLLGGIGGYLDKTSGAPTILSLNFVRLAKALGQRLWSTLWVPVNWTTDWERWLVAAFVLALVAVALCAWRGVSTPAFAALAGAVILALPVQHMLMIGPDLEKSRIVYLPSAAYALLIGFALSQLPARHAALAGTAFLLWNAAALQHNLDQWGRSAWTARASCEIVANALRNNDHVAQVTNVPNILDGVYFLYADVGPCADLTFGIPANRVREAGRSEEGIPPATLFFEWDPAARLLRPRQK